MLQRQIRRANAKRKPNQLKESFALSENETALAEVLKWLLDGVKDNEIPFRKGCEWTTPILIAVAILWIWLDEPSLTGRYERSLKICGGVALSMRTINRNLSTSMDRFSGATGDGFGSPVPMRLYKRLGRIGKLLDSKRLYSDLRIGCYSRP